MSHGLHPALQIRVDEARRYAEIPPTTAPHGVSHLRLHLPHLPRLHRRRHLR